MEVSFDTVQRMTIRPDSGCPIYLLLENFRPGVGRMTVICDGDVWSYGWGAMGERTPTLETFIAKCHPEYVTKKLAPNLFPTEDEDNPKMLVEHAKKHIVERRREDEYNRGLARELYDRCDELRDGIQGNEELLYEIYGDEWWYETPKKTNPDYERLYRIVETIIQAFREFPSPVPSV